MSPLSRFYMKLAVFLLSLLLYYNNILNHSSGGDVNIHVGWATAAFTDGADTPPPPPKYFSVPMHEVARKDLYLKAMDSGEVVVAYAEAGLDFKPHDYLTHADGLRFLSSSLTEFLKSQEREIVVPVVDDEDEMGGGNRVIGFVLIQPITPRKLLARRGEVQFDFKEGGGVPINTKSKAELALNLPGVKNGLDGSNLPNGGGKCITSRDCFNYNGSCIGGLCRCPKDSYMGSYCQLHIPLSKEQIALQNSMKERNSIINNADKDNKIKEIEAAKLGKESPDVKKKINFINIDSITDYSDPSLVASMQDIDDENPNQRRRTITSASTDSDTAATTTMKPPSSAPSSSSIHTNGLSSSSSVRPTQAQTEPLKAKVEVGVESKSTSSSDDDNSGSGIKDGGDNNADSGASKVAPKKIVKTKVKPKPSSELNSPPSGDVSSSDDSKIEKKTASQEQQQQQQQQTQYDEQKASIQKQMRVEDLYGDGKVYPEPYLAGKLPRQLIHDRQRNRLASIEFVYAVRFRSGPLGIAFDNKIATHTVVEKVTGGQQGEQSDIKPGDVLVAIDTFNVTKESPKNVLRLITTLPWPKVLTFKSFGKDTGDIVKAAELNKRRSFNISAIYPPTLVIETSARLAEWSAELNLAILNYCPIYLVKTPKDNFGCSVDEGEYKLPIEIQDYLDYLDFVKDPMSADGFRLYDRLHSNATSKANSNPNDPLDLGANTAATAAAAAEEGVDSATDKSTKAKDSIIGPPSVTFTEDEVQFFRSRIEHKYPMSFFLIEEAKRAKINFKLLVMPVLKRGSCTFVEKAVMVTENGGDFGIMVNNNNELSDLPAGKDSTSGCKKPFAITREDDTTLWHAAGLYNEILTVISDPIIGYTSDCIQLQGLAEDLLEKWPHSVPKMDLTTILKTKLPNKDKMRSLTDEGGRIAISGENGWAYFDYHLAMFGPQDVPLGPFRMQVALPSPFGCDEKDYNVRIKGTIVAILRGGGCSFGIKVINAQKLGAKAVMIVNTDDTKTMRLMALPDETPLITIPCIMVSRRIQYYFEEKLKMYGHLNQLLISIQPMLYNGEYEKRNTVVLPQRIDTMK